jgi:hypothetical protein
LTHSPRAGCRSQAESIAARNQAPPFAGEAAGRPGREIVFSANCDAAAEKPGGYDLIDDALIPIFDSLHHNPEGFDKVGLDWSANRFIVTKPFGSVPALVWLVYIEIGGRVVIDHVEEHEDY